MFYAHLCTMIGDREGLSLSVVIVRLYDASENVLRGEFTHGGQVISGSWDKTLKCWDPRGASSQERTLVGYALSSVEGRVAMEFFDLTEAGQSKKYAFKCHRKSEAGRDIVYPVNTIAFHPVSASSPKPLNPPPTDIPQKPKPTPTPQKPKFTLPPKA
ncbi:putative transcription factor WD40-like family [Helianthus annuus]|nr:putative transcription factor WD40-like family [Helianthus annuus]